MRGMRRPDSEQHDAAGLNITYFTEMFSVLGPNIGACQIVLRPRSCLLILWRSCKQLRSASTWRLQVREYVVQLETHLAEVHRQAQRLIERQGKLGSSMSEFGASMVALGKFESGSLAYKFQKLGERADTLAAASQVPSQK